MKTTIWIIMFLITTGGAIALVQNYDYGEIVVGDSMLNAFSNDVDIFPFAGDSTNLNSRTEATTIQYSNISTIDIHNWTSADPGVGDQILTEFEMQINESVNDIKNIDFFFLGSGSVNVNYSIWVLKAGQNRLVSANWTLLGGEQVFTANVQAWMNRTLDYNISTYINVNGSITWAIYEELRGIMRVNYVALNVTYFNPNWNSTLYIYNLTSLVAQVSDGSIVNLTSNTTYNFKLSVIQNNSNVAGITSKAKMVGFNTSFVITNITDENTTVTDLHTLDGGIFSKETSGASNMWNVSSSIPLNTPDSTYVFAADTDGVKNDLIVVRDNSVSAINQSGMSLWNRTETTTGGAGITDDNTIGYSNGTMFRIINRTGNIICSVGLMGNSAGYATSVIAVDQRCDGTKNEFAFATLNPNISVFVFNASCSQLWNDTSHTVGNNVRMYDFDYDADGSCKEAIATRGINTLVALNLSNGKKLWITPTFTNPPYVFAPFDLENDGLLNDFLVTDSSSYAGQIKVINRTGNVSCTYSAPNAIDTRTAAEAYDLDGDGKYEGVAFAEVEYDGEFTSLWLINRSCNLQKNINMSLNLNAELLGAYDLNGDNRTDFIVKGSGGKIPRELRVYNGETDERMANFSDFQAVSGYNYVPNTFAFADFNSDGNIDWASSYNFTYAQTLNYTGNGLLVWNPFSGNQFTGIDVAENVSYNFTIVPQGITGLFNINYSIEGGVNDLNITFNINWTTATATPSNDCTPPVSGDWIINDGSNCTLSTDTVITGSLIINLGSLDLQARLKFGGLQRQIILDSGTRLSMNNSQGIG